MSAPRLAEPPGSVTLPVRRLPSRTDGSAADARVAGAYRAHRDRLRSILVRSGLGSGDADEVSQDAFWVFAQRVADVPERAERAFLTSTALRLASDRRRSAWHGVMSREWTREDWESKAAGPEELCSGFEERKRLDAALALLGEQERDAFILAAVEGLSRNEAADVLHVAPGTMASRLARARGQLELALRHLPDGALPHGPAFGVANAERLVGAQRFLTNPWGNDKVRGRFEQRLIERRHAGTTQTGWYWHWPGLDHTVFAYPEVLVGWKPWRGGDTTDVRLPIAVSRASNLLVAYDVETRATGSYNLAISTWLTSVEGGTQQARPETITTEVMVWPQYSSGASPPGRFYRNVNLSGEDYELWIAPHHGRRFEADRNGWTVLTLRGVGGRAQGHLALGSMLADLASRGLLDVQDYVSSVELGNEVMGGTGTTFVEEFSIAL